MIDDDPLTITDDIGGVTMHGGDRTPSGVRHAR
jgi:hypothetical protein